MASNVNRPPVMSELSINQATELEGQVDEGDRAGFDIRARSYGWTQDQADEVWDWLTQLPPDEDDLEAVAP